MLMIPKGLQAKTGNLREQETEAVDGHCGRADAVCLAITFRRSRRWQIAKTRPGRLLRNGLAGSGRRI